MKNFEVIHSFGSRWSNNWRGTFRFRCYESNCEDCKAKFLCFTNKKVFIEDMALFNKLIEKKNALHYCSYKHSQRLYRKIFFKWLITKGLTNN